MTTFGEVIFGIGMFAEGTLYGAIIIICLLAKDRGHKKLESPL